MKFNTMVDCIVEVLYHMRCSSGGIRSWYRTFVTFVPSSQLGEEGTSSDSDGTVHPVRDGPRERVLFTNPWCFNGEWKVIGVQ